MEATPLPTTGREAGKEAIMAATYAPLTGDVLIDRAAWKAAGCPSDHPYLEACKASVEAPRPSFVEPLVPSLSEGQRAAVEASREAFEAASRANIAAMMRGAR